MFKWSLARVAPLRVPHSVFSAEATGMRAARMAGNNPPRKPTAQAHTRPIAITAGVTRSCAIIDPSFAPRPNVLVSVSTEPCSPLPLSKSADHGPFPASQSYFVADSEPLKLRLRGTPHHQFVESWLEPSTLDNLDLGSHERALLTHTAYHERGPDVAVLLSRLHGTHHLNRGDRIAIGGRRDSWCAQDRLDLVGEQRTADFLIRASAKDDCSIRLELRSSGGLGLVLRR